MDKFISLFFGNFIGGLGLESLVSVFPTTSVALGVGSTIIGSKLYEFNDNEVVELLGISSIATGVSIAFDGLDAYEKTMNELQLTQSYVESLDESQLNDLVERLEAKDNELAGGKQKIKTL